MLYRLQHAAVDSERGDVEAVSFGQQHRVRDTREPVWDRGRGIAKRGVGVRCTDRRAAVYRHSRGRRGQKIEAVHAATLAPARHSRQGGGAALIPVREPVRMTFTAMPLILAFIAGYVNR